MIFLVAEGNFNNFKTKTPEDKKKLLSRASNSDNPLKKNIISYCTGQDRVPEEQDRAA